MVVWSPGALSPHSSKLDEIKKLTKIKLENLIRNKWKNYKIYGFGGGHKAATIISVMGLFDKILFVYDNDINKIGSYVAGTNIKIKHPKKITNKKIILINFAIDYRKEILNYIKDRKINCIFVDLFPSIKLNNMSYD